MQQYTFIVDPEDEGARIDKYLSEQIEEYSREYIKKSIDKGNLTINGKLGKPSNKLKAYDKITIDIPEIDEIRAVSENIPLDIMYEDDDLIVVNKPQGMVVHPAPGNYTGTLVNALLYHTNENLSKNNGIIRPGIVHRIDKDTSGVLVVAKNNLAHEKLAKQFSAHTINRKYHAIVHNNFSEDKGTVNAPIGRHPVDRIKMAVTNSNSKSAITHYKVLERYGLFTYIECKLETGRTHQIRVHMAHIKHPLLGDTLYGPQKQSFKLQGQALHAKVLGFIHPTKNEYMEFESELPDYFKELLNKLSK